MFHITSVLSILTDPNLWKKCSFLLIHLLLIMVIHILLLSVNPNFLDYEPLKELAMEVLRRDGKIHAAEGDYCF